MFTSQVQYSSYKGVISFLNYLGTFSQSHRLQPTALGATLSVADPLKRNPSESTDVSQEGSQWFRESKDLSQEMLRVNLSGRSVGQGIAQIKIMRTDAAANSSILN
jgi:hypothetical protein